MQSTLDPKPTDDPHDFLVVPPDVVRVVPGEEEISKLLREAARHHSDPQTHAGSDLAAGPPVPSVDATFRAAAVNNVVVPGQRRSIGKGVLRGFAALLLAVCIGVAATAWQSQGDAARQMLATWAPQLVPILTSSLPPEKPGLSAQPAPAAVEAAAANTAPSQPAPPAQAAPEGVAPAAPSPDSSQLLQSMARNLASAGQEIEQLKASVEQLKAGQQQLSRDLARASEVRASEVRASEVRASEVRASEQSTRPRISKLSAPPPRPAAGRVRKPMPPIPPAQAAATPILPQTAAPYYAPYAPRQIEPQPQATAQPEADPELSAVPRPPMPVR